MSRSVVGLSNESLALKISELAGQDQLDRALAKEMVLRLSRLDSIERTNNNLMAESRKLLTNLDVSEKNKTEFLANIKNKINNPLCVLLVLVEHMAGKAQNESDEQMLKHISYSIMELDFTLKNLLFAGELESGSYSVDVSKFKLEPLVKRSLEYFKAQVDDKELQISVNCVSNLSFISDESKIFSILLNLISNAIEYNKDKGQVFIDIEVKGADLEILVKDTGIGFDKEDIGRMFIRFNQLGADPSRPHVSSGIGLALVKSIVDILDGSLTCDSKIGEGSEFQVVIPKTVKVAGLEEENDIFFDMAFRESKEF